MNLQKINPSAGRHCMVVHAYYPLSETRVEREAQVLLKHQYAVDIICLRADGESPMENVDGAVVYRLPVRRGTGRGAVAQLFEYLAFLVLAFFKLIVLQYRRRYGTVQVHNLPDFLVFAALIPKLMGARIILDIHDLMPEFFLARFHSDPHSLLVRLVFFQEQLSCRFADHVITVSDHWRKTLIERGISPEKCSVVLNVADERIFHLDPDTAARKSAKPRFHLIYHGTIVHRYGLDLAVQAVDAVREEIPGIHLTILGIGDYVKTLRRMVEELHLEQHVTIFNELRPAHELPQIICAADLGIAAYRSDPFTDGLIPTKLMEYAALGIPAIAARTTAIEAYFNNTMVELFKPGDKDALADCMRKLFHHPERMAELADGCAVFNQRHNWTKIGAEYAALVARLNRKKNMRKALNPTN
jgi:glycosyltransferase involved in cell wall biosynthesis